jgi:hypothetical protein
MRSGTSRVHRRRVVGGLGLVAVLAFATSACSKEGNADLADTGTTPTLSVLIVHALSNSQLGDVVSKLLSTGSILAIDTFDARDGTPTLAQLQTYGAVLVVSDFGFDDRDTLGDVLADHVDGGGGVVLSMFAMSTPFVPSDPDSRPDTPGGRFESGGYTVISPSIGNGDADGPHGMTALIPGHPILDGVGTFSGGRSSYRPEGSTVAGDIVAVWDDGADTPLVGVREIAGVRRADVGFYPPTSDAGRADFVDPSTDALRMLANALRWVAGEL